MRRLLVLLVLLAPAAAYAQVVFPADSAYKPLRCANQVMTDLEADTAGFLDDRDVVGDANAAAALRASDDNNLYLRIRLEDDPAANGQVDTASWGMEWDLDNDPTDYELLVLAEGIAGPAGTVQVFRNTTTTRMNTPDDPADMPAAQTYQFANNAATKVAPGTTFGGSADYFLDVAVPWSALVPLGLDRDTPTRVWVGSSASANSLNGDLACHGGGGGAPTLSGGTASDPTTGDPNDPGAVGGTGRLEGGGGCSTTGGGSGAGLLVALGLVGLARRRRR